MKIRITPGALLLLLVLLFSKSRFFAASLLAAAFHECGHLLASRLLGIRLAALELDLCGARLFPARAIPSYPAEALLAAAGPAASLLLALLLAPLSSGLAASLRAATLSLALFNLLPIEGFDGGRILSSLLSLCLSEQRAETFMSIASYITLLLLFSLSACLLLRFGENPTLAVLSASIFARQFLPTKPSGR